MRRLLTAILALLTLCSGLAVPRPARATPPAFTSRAQNPWVWIARFFFEQVASYMVSRGLEALSTRANLITSGNRAVNNIDDIVRIRALTERDRAELHVVRRQILDIVYMLRDNNRTDAELRQSILTMQARFNRSIAQVRTELAAMDGRLRQIEAEQGRQVRTLVDMQGQINALQNDVAQQRQELGDVRNRVSDVESVVYADPSRWLRNGWAFSGSALYGNSMQLPNSARIGMNTELQYNFNKHLGFFTDVFWSPLNASDTHYSSSTNSRVLWQSVGGTLGLMINALPPQSPISFQLEGGGGVVYSSLAEFSDGTDLFDWGHSNPLGSVSNVAGIAKAELGLAPTASRVEPFVSAAYIRTLDDIAISNSTVTSNAGNTIWYATLGIRLRVYAKPPRD
jgi:uncharacterized coiled-coil protein SlyX